MYNTFFYETPIGKLKIVEDGESIVEVCFEQEEIKYENIEILETDLLKNAGKQLNEYFNGERKEFNLPLNPKGTEFQKKVWNALLNIPYGKTASYKDIATMIGNDKASRAVGMANNRNPIPILIPCHRVIGSNGKLVGYGGGIDTKIKLLDLENKNKFNY